MSASIFLLAAMACWVFGTFRAILMAYDSFVFFGIAIALFFLQCGVWIAHLF